MIILSCCIKISAVCCFISSQSTRVTDGQTDEWTEGREEPTDGQIDRITIPKTSLATASRGKNGHIRFKLLGDSPLEVDRTCTSKFAVRTSAQVCLASHCSRRPSNSLLYVMLLHLRAVFLVGITTESLRIK